MSTYCMDGLSECFPDTIMWYIKGQYEMTLNSLDGGQKEEFRVNVAGSVARVILLILQKWSSKLK